MRIDTSASSALFEARPSGSQDDAGDTGSPTDSTRMPSGARVSPPSLRASEAIALLARLGAFDHSTSGSTVARSPGASSVADPSAADERALAGLADLLGSASSPDLLLLALEQELGARARGGVEDRIRDAEVDARQASTERAAARARAAKASRRARRAMQRAPKWVRKLVKAVIALVGVAAAACTGGAAAGIAIAGIVLALCAPAFQKMAEKLGLDPEKARWVGFACSLAGAALSAGAGFASTGTLVGTAATIADAARTTRAVVEGVTTLVDGIRQAATSILERTVAEAGVDAERSGLLESAANEAIDELVETLRAAMSHAARVARFASDVVEIENGTRDALLGALAGARR